MGNLRVNSRMTFSLVLGSLVLGLIVTVVYLQKPHDVGAKTVSVRPTPVFAAADYPDPDSESTPPHEDAGPALSQQAVAPEEAGKPAIETLLYALDTMEVELEEFVSLGGALESLGDYLLAATPRGRLALIQPQGEVVYLDTNVPMNQAGLEAHAFSETPDATSVRVTDILLQEQAPGHYTLFAAHHYFTDTCIRFRLSATTLQHAAGSVTVLPSWHTLFDAEPCMPFEAPSDRWWFALHQAGGKMVMDGPDHLLLMIGDHGFSHGPDHLGKLVRIEIATGAADVLTRGHRNAQGLVRDAQGHLWATEHGPQGGDELNLLVPGGHYGWPFVTYGIGYFGEVYPDIEYDQVGRHDGFVRPVFAWVPSIAPSSIAVNDPMLAPLWRDDLIVASLKNQSLYRIRRHGVQIQYVEQIEIGRRVRDIHIMSDGRLALLLDEHRVLFLRRSHYYCDAESQEQRKVYAVDCPATNDAVTGADAVDVAPLETQDTGSARVSTPSGEQLFGMYCGACHSLNAVMYEAGPHLVDVVGRRAGTIDGFRFSSAFRALDHVWTRDSLEQFLADPEWFVPGTSMATSELAAGEVRALVDFILATASTEQ